MAKDYKLRFKCLKCGNLHQQVWAARDCCEMLRIFMCHLCDTEHLTSLEAMECCTEVKEDE